MTLTVPQALASYRASEQLELRFNDLFQKLGYRLGTNRHLRSISICRKRKIPR